MQNQNERIYGNEHPADSVENLLQSFAPAPLKINRDELLFQAGLAAGRSAGSERVGIRPLSAMQIWRAAAILSSALALVMTVLFLRQPERIVIVERKSTEEKSSESLGITMPRAHPPETQPANDEPTLSATTHDVSSSPATAMLTNQRDNYVARRDRLLRDGLEAWANMQLTTADGPAKPVATQREMLREFTGRQIRANPSDSFDWWNPWHLQGDRS